jgi:hypothetical protein
MNLIVIKVKILVLVTLSLNGYIGPPPNLLIMLTIEHRMIMFMVFVLEHTLPTHQPNIEL